MPKIILVGGNGDSSDYSERKKKPLGTVYAKWLF
jgi:hypothetical protein